MRIAVIIPALNEARNIQQTLEPLQAWRRRGHQVIVVDGGSTDDTIKCATELADHIISSEPGRALQMNTGAEQAEADILLFLHADTLIQSNADQWIINSVSQQHYWGRFDVAFDSNKFVFKWIAALMNIRSCISSIATGDQAIFVEKALFDQLGRFPLISLMEDIQLSINLRKHQRAQCLRQKVITSARRWEQKGIIRTIILMWGLRLGYFLGLPADRLKSWYK